MKKQWEYRVEFLPDQTTAIEQLNTLGEDGWELVAAWSDTPGETMYALKREKTK